VIIADTGFFLALANEKDEHHGAAKRAVQRVTERLVTTWPVMTEACDLFANRLSRGAAETFIVSAARGALSSTSSPRTWHASGTLCASTASS
jgi:predicted nucleic acid-binding protein